ncbi:MAG: transposase [Nitrospirae bacterium]|nr:transposase [Nitrospirota bacterium]
MKKNMGIFGAVRAADGKMITTLAPTFNAVTFKQFLVSLLRHHRKGRKIIVVSDNALWHHARLLAP